MQNSLNGIQGVEIGVIVGVQSDGEVAMKFSDGSTRTARTLWNGVDIAWRDYVGRRAAVAAAGGTQEFWVLLGLVDETGVAVSSSRLVRQHAKVQRLEAQEELHLECGKAKISLRADGRIEILGGYLLSRSTGVHKIKGGSVEIN